MSPDVSVARCRALRKLISDCPTADSRWSSGTDTVALIPTGADNVTQVASSSEFVATGGVADPARRLLESLGRQKFNAKKARRSAYDSGRAGVMFYVEPAGGVV